MQLSQYLKGATEKVFFFYFIIFFSFIIIFFSSSYTPSLVPFVFRIVINLFVPILSLFCFISYLVYLIIKLFCYSGFRVHISLVVFVIILSSHILSCNIWCFLRFFLRVFHFHSINFLKNKENQKVVNYRIFN